MISADIDKIEFSSLDGIPRSVWHQKKLSTMNGFSQAQIHHTITIRWHTKSVTITAHNSHNSNHHIYSHCRSHWKRKNISHRHRLSPHGNCIKHNRLYYQKWNRIINCIRTEPKVINRNAIYLLLLNWAKCVRAMAPHSWTLFWSTPKFKKIFYLH